MKKRYDNTKETHLEYEIIDRVSDIFDGLETKSLFRYKWVYYP